MIEARVTVIDETREVKKATDRAAFRSLAHAAATIRLAAQRSIATSDEPSPEGQPPHTRRGAMRRAIRFEADERQALVGPVASQVGQSAAAHEFGGDYHGRRYPRRPFMGPALRENLGRFRDSWRGQIRQT